MPFDRQQFLCNHRGITAAWGDRLPEWNDATRGHVSASLRGERVKTPDNLICGRGPLDFLATAWRETGDETYAAAAREQLERALPKAGEQCTSGGTLGISFTVGNCMVASWLGTLPHFIESDAFDDAFAGEIIATAGMLLDFLHDHIGTGNMNWRIAHADCLLLSGLRLSFIPEAARWRKLGLDALNDAFHRQIMPDGVHVERNPHYHTWMNCVMDSYHRLGAAMPELGLVVERDAVARMWDYSLGATRPNGDENAMHDSQAIRSGRIYNEALHRRSAFRLRVGLPDEPPPTSQWFPDAGQAFLRDSWNEDATYVTFDATLWGTDHCHYSRNAIQVHAHGRTLLCDPGWLSETGTYSKTAMGLYGKSTRAHNTLSLNGWNQAETNPARTRYRHTDGYDLVRSDFEGGYHPGDSGWTFPDGMGLGIWGSHHRTLLWIHGRAIVVIDSMFRQHVSEPEKDDEIPSLESNWQLCDGAAPEIDERAGRLVTTHDDANVLMLFPLLPDGIEWTIREGQADPPRGWVSGPAFQGVLLPAPQLCLNVPKMAGRWAEFVTVIVPFAGADVPQVTAEAEPTAPDNVGSLKMQWGDGTVDELQWYYRLDLMIGEREGFDTDGSMIHLCRDRRGAVIQGAVVDGTYARPFTQSVRCKPEMFRIM